MTAKAKIEKEEPAGKGPSFEHSLQRLEEIVETIEQGKVSLDDVMKIYEEGIHLSKSCLDQLSQAEMKLKRLGKDLEGNFALFDETQDE